MIIKGGVVDVQVIKCFIRNQRLWRYTSGVIYEGTYGYLKFEFVFKTEDWNTAEKKTAVFSYKGKNYEVELDVNNQCIVPKEVIHDPCFKVSVYGNEIHTNTVTIPVEPNENGGGCDCSGTSGVYVPEVTPDNMLVFTLEKEPKEERLEFDIDPSNNWNQTGELVESNYIWEPMG